ncbi:MAG: PepSY-like domain-containing protein [Muribaculaceae bacterium]|nr:PepSY-like domain-containing protein [Muribaculaceae bacterium]
MKKTVLLIVAIVLCGGVMNAQKVKEIEPKKLPDISLRTLASYFGGLNVTQAVYIDEKMDRHYEVSLDDGTIIHFDKQGVWKFVKAGGDAIPDRMIPGMVLMHLQKNKIEAKVVGMMRDKDKNYIIDLSDGTTLTFTETFKLVE